MIHRRPLLLSGVLLAATAAFAPRVAAEPKFLSKQYPRCTACHYSPTGGGLLTPYGRSLSREEISMSGRSGGTPPSPEARAEEAFLFGLLPDTGPLQLGLDLRPSRLRTEIPGRDIPPRNFLMNLDAQAAWRAGAWTAYATAGRRPGGGLVSYEHWIERRVSDRVSVRGGRLLPAYGVRFSDHTLLSRDRLDLAEDDQIYGVELGFAGDRTLVQVAAGPGRAESLGSDDGRGALTAAGRIQRDLGPRTVLVGSALYRSAGERLPRSAAAGLSFGYAPRPWLVSWIQADLRFPDLAFGERGLILVNQTSLELARGVWIRLAPQVHRESANPYAEIRRMTYGLDLYPRTHWHVGLSWYRDRFVSSGRLHSRLLAQLHLYL